MLPRVGVPITLHFSVRYLLRTGLLSRMSQYSVPVIVARWNDAELHAELEAAGCEVHELPPVRTGPWFDQCRSRLNVWHFRRVTSPSTAIDRRRGNLSRTPMERLRRDLRLGWYGVQQAMPGGIDRLLAEDRAAVAGDTNIDEFGVLLRRLRLDAVFTLTPFLPEEELLLRAATERRIPMCTAILSFDNITTRGWIPVTFDRYLLWNSYNERELRRAYPESRARAVTIVGAPQFDFYWDASYLWEESEWRRILGLPLDRPVILYGGGAKSIVPHEPMFVRHIDEAITRGELPRNPIILFRRHPIDPPERWEELRHTARHVVFDEPWDAARAGGHVNVRRTDVERLASTLRYSRVHVNVSSTLSVDGAIFDKPQIGPAYDDRPGKPCDRVTRELYLREHFLPITHSGGIDVATSRDAMIEALRASLADPDRGREGRQRMVRDICTFDDGRATSRVSDSLQAFLHGQGTQAPAPVAASTNGVGAER